MPKQNLAILLLMFFALVGCSNDDANDLITITDGRFDLNLNTLSDHVLSKTK